MSRFATPAELRDFLEVTGTSGRKSDTNLGMLLDSASDYLERITGRTITSTGSNTTRTFTTNGRAYVDIGDWRTITSVTLQGATLDLDQSYWPVTARQSSDIIVGLQLRAFGSGRPYSYLANPQWFDRNLDSPYRPSSLPNDLEVTGLGGWTTTPPEWKHATIALAAYYYHHADAFFAGGRQTPDGAIFDLASLPVEVRELIRAWSLGEQAVVV